MHLMMSANYLRNVYALTSLWHTETISTIRHHYWKQYSWFFCKPHNHSNTENARLPLSSLCLCWKMLISILLNFPLMSWRH